MPIQRTCVGHSSPRTALTTVADDLCISWATEEVGPMFKYVLAIALIAVAVAFGVQKLQEKGTSSGPTVVTVTVPIQSQEATTATEAEDSTCPESTGMMLCLDAAR